MKRYWDEVEVGDSLPEFSSNPISRLQIAQFASASDEFSPLYLDDDLAKDAGYGGVYAPSLISLGYVEKALRSFAVNMRILSLKSTFQRLIWPGDTLFPKGMVIRRYLRNEEHRLQMELWCQNQNDDIVMKGTGVCLLFKNEEQEKASKNPQPKISMKTHQAFLEKYLPLIGSKIKKDSLNLVTESTN